MSLETPKEHWDRKQEYWDRKRRELLAHHAKIRAEHEAQENERQSAWLREKILAYDAVGALSYSDMGLLLQFLEWVKKGS